MQPHAMMIRLCFTAAMLFGVCQASFDANISSYINVQMPVQLHEHNVSGGLIHRQAQFGKHFDLWQQEGHIAALTHFAEGPLCSMPDANITKNFGEPPFFLLADMGGCTPISKARRAQELGAAGLIITTHNCLCSENCTDEEHCIDELPHLHDDGTGESVSIPTMIISHGKASHLKAAIRKGHAILMEMAWHEPKMEHTVRADFWYAPNHKSTEEFLANFSGLAHTLGDHLDFRPHHYVFDGHRMQCEGQSDDPKQPCFNMCTNNGRYCYVSYGYNHHGISGKDVVTESLRRMCLIKHHTPGVFWEYVNHFQTLCDSIDYFANKDCVKDALKHSNVKEKAIEECMKDSGDVATDQPNSLLEVAMEASAHIVETPTLHINGMPMKWPLNTRAVFESICLGYQTGKAPHVCAACAMCGDPVACASRTPMHCNAQDGRIPDSKKSSTGGKKSGGGFGHFVLVVLILTGIGGVVYYKKFMEDGDRPSYSGYSLGDALMSDTA